MVAPLVGAWIEIGAPWGSWKRGTSSLLLWERGLKYQKGRGTGDTGDVAPLVGAWIEMLFYKGKLRGRSSLSSCGSVD